MNFKLEILTQIENTNIWVDANIDNFNINSKSFLITYNNK